jgi:hypothetical protein
MLPLSALRTSSYFRNEYILEYNFELIRRTFITTRGFPLFHIINTGDAAAEGFLRDTDFTRPYFIRGSNILFISFISLRDSL